MQGFDFAAQPAPELEFSAEPHVSNSRAQISLLANRGGFIWMCELGGGKGNPLMNFLPVFFGGDKCLRLTEKEKNCITHTITQRPTHDGAKMSQLHMYDF